MVLPLALPAIISGIGSIAGAGAGIFGAISGANAQDEANQMNWAINLYNQRKRDKEREDSMRYAEQLRGENKLGATDAQGTSTKYVEGKGWVTTLGDRPQALEDYFYSQELPERQSQFRRKAERSRTNEDMAGQLLQEFQRIAKENPQDIEKMLMAAASSGISEQTEATLRPALMQALRSGSGTAVEDVTRSVGNAGMDARRKAGMDAKLQSLDYVDSKYNQQRGQASELYRMFAQMAGQDIGASVEPGQALGPANAMMQNFAGAANQSGANSLNAVAQKGGTIQPYEANTSEANMWGAIGNIGSGLGDRLGSIMDRSSSNQMLRDYITQGGQLNLNQGGLMDLMTERVRAGGGVY